MQVDQREDKGSQGEGRKTEWAWVGKLAEAWLVWTDLHLTTEWWEISSGAVNQDLADWAMVRMVDDVVRNVGKRVLLVNAVDGALLNILSAVVHSRDIVGAGGH